MQFTVPKQQLLAAAVISLGSSDWPKRLCDNVGRLKKPTEGRTLRNQTSSEAARTANSLEGAREGLKEGEVAFFQN